MNRNLKKQGTEMKEKIYRFIVDYITENGFAPTIREISKEVNICTSNVLHYLTMLEIDGRIKTKRNSPRAIRVIGYKYVKEVKQ